MKLFRFFRKKRGAPSPEKALTLVSVHIPKTAGTSFRKSLKTAYGEEEVVRLDINLKNRRARLNEEEYEEDFLPNGIQVVHGHFSPAVILEQFPETSGVDFITWVRHPVERVISNYFYLEKRLKEELDEAGKGLNILSKMQRSLLEYARDEINRNRQHKFLEGMLLEDFKFVGVQEHYTDDLAELGLRLGWKEVKETAVNITAREKPAVSDETRAEIARLNERDMALYEQALHLRSRRKEKP
ncbi:sulfotransferase family 2 domain-containing protein [Neolewinella aurantiaca]|uniref:sulfotransferase family 2 domain-containing protein n=1 Tax=Neolewinella aurantiaca TaxID=2602767 RepID=UPI00164F83B6|nr:sulfotransferase family 2 domain-containing protein [Neolewinella aurantiaca]